MREPRSPGCQAHPTQPHMCLGCECVEIGNRGNWSQSLGYKRGFPRGFPGSIPDPERAYMLVHHNY